MFWSIIDLRDPVPIERFMNGEGGIPIYVHDTLKNGRKLLRAQVLYFVSAFLGHVSVQKSHSNGDLHIIPMPRCAKFGNFR